ncbi:MAG: NAD-dependent epimerase/dehydratase family protein, partial [Pirellula sp.]
VVDSMLPAYGATLENVASIRNGIRINFSDVRDRHSLAYLVQDQEVIFSLAGQVSHIDSMTNPLVDLDINCRSQLSLLECCRRSNPHARLVLSGTRQVYGKPRSLPVREDHPIAPADVNGINKWAAEMYFSLYAQVYGMSTICLRLTNTYGPRMDLKNRNKGFVGVFIGQALRGETIRIFGDGEQRRDFNYVSDVVDALLGAGCRSDVSGKSFNLGHDSNHSLLDFVEVLREQCTVKYELVPFPENLRSIDIGDYYADYSSFREWTGWKPQVELKDGLERTIRYYQHGRLVVA